MTGFASLLAAARQPDGTLRTDVPDGWRQGRTAFGGFSSAMAYHAARAAEPDLPPLRSAQIAFAGPAGASLDASAAVLRRGRSSAFVEARLHSEGQLALLGTFLFLAGRPSPAHIAGPAMPDAPQPEEAAPAMRGKGSGFTGRMEYRHALGPDARGAPLLMRWVRLHEREGLDAITELFLIGDALPPGIAPALPAPPIGSSANWTVNLHDPGIDPLDGWWLVRTEAVSASAGISVQHMAVWNRAGTPAVSATQIVSFTVPDQNRGESHG